MGCVAGQSRDYLSLTTLLWENAPTMPVKNSKTAKTTSMATNPFCFMGNLLSF